MPAGVGVLERSVAASKPANTGLCSVRFGVERFRFSRSMTSSCKAFSMAIRTKDESRESVVRPKISGTSEAGGSGGSSFDDAIELGGRSECADGRRLGNVLMEPVTAVPVDLELNVA